MKQTYDNYFRKYYEDHKEQIKENTSKYKVSYNKKYYKKNKERIAAKRKAKKTQVNKVLDVDSLKKLTDTKIYQL